jgi:UDP-GlcNAc:undecaprenyl-phosphate/decaprenyl-phosphate GlcNAc-1-phosphate transferase
MILGIPILDTLFAIIRRLLKHQPPFSPDKDHIHHQLLGMNFSHRTTVLIIYAIDLLFAMASILYILKDPFLGKVFYILIFIVVVWFVFRTSVISPKNKEVTDNIIDKVEGTLKKDRNKQKNSG